MLVASGVLALAACGPPADPVAALIAAAERAAEERDAERLGLYLAPDFAAEHGLDRAQTIDQVRRYLAAYESVSIGVTGVETTRDEASARVRCVVEFSGRARRVFGLEGLLPPEAVYRFEVDLVRPGDEWLVKRASWQPVPGVDEVR
jgi:hypothetical protein